jgi:hypothetical protein
MLSSEHPGGITSPGVVPDFQEHHGDYVGVGEAGRSWCISKTLTGWRLEFQDPGDVTPTYAGTHASLVLAEREAQRKP